MGSAATMGMYTTAISVVYAIIALVAGAFLLNAYVRTRMSSLIWLLLAVVVWPILVRISYPVLGWALSQGGGISMFGLPPGLGLVVIETAVGSLVGGALLIVACVSLSRELTQRPALTTPAFPASYAGVPQPYAPSDPNRRSL